jgi:hypothetical protein
MNIKVVSLKNIHICLSYGLKTTEFGAHAHVWAWRFGPQLSHFCPI